MHDIALRPVPEASLLTVEERLTVDDLPGFIEDAVRRIHGHLEAGGAAAAGPCG